MYKYKVGDQVQVTTGKDKGKKGKVEKVLETENKLIVSGVNVYKRHRKVSARQAAGIYEITRPILASKVAIICPKCGKLTRVGFQMDGKIKIRTCKKCKGTITV